MDRNRIGGRENGSDEPLYVRFVASEMHPGAESERFCPRDHRVVLAYNINHHKDTVHSSAFKDIYWYHHSWLGGMSIKVNCGQLGIAFRLLALSSLALPPFQQLSTTCASFLPPFLNVFSRLLDALLDVLNLGCHIAIDFLKKVNKLVELFRS